MTDDRTWEIIQGDDEPVEVSDNEVEAEPPCTWEIPAFPTTSREELASLTKEELQERLKKMQKNASLVRRTLESDEARLSQVLLDLIKKKKELLALTEERDHSYWGGKNGASPSLPLFLDRRLHSVYEKISGKLDEETQKYDILYEQLKEILPKEAASTLPIPHCRKDRHSPGRAVLDRLKVLEETLTTLAASNYKMENRQQKAATHRALVRFSELNSRMADVEQRKEKAEAALFKNKDEYQIKYWDLYGRVEICKQRLSELRKTCPEEVEEVSEDDGLDLDDLEEVDDTEEPKEPPKKESMEVVFGDDEHLDYDVSDSEINS